jgi:hypothetical protein
MSTVGVIIDSFSSPKSQLQLVRRHYICVYSPQSNSMWLYLHAEYDIHPEIKAS